MSPSEMLKSRKCSSDSFIEDKIAICHLTKKLTTGTGTTSCERTRGREKMVPWKVHTLNSQEQRAPRPLTTTFNRLSYIERKTMPRASRMERYHNKDARSGGPCSPRADMNFHGCVLRWQQQYTVPQVHSQTQTQFIFLLQTQQQR